ncbi:unnamed protein product [Coffea canephora]|uniref:Uncharacterized protein n=1 Tax=Coffea canephora TaxID=49390 RepID=A0A068UK89_COFCA|nr:unnamed protein product [Coffea canephora]
MGDDLMIQGGGSVNATGIIAQIPMSEAYLGHIINAWLSLLMLGVV